MRENNWYKARQSLDDDLIIFGLGLSLIGDLLVLLAWAGSGLSWTWFKFAFIAVVFSYISWKLHTAESSNKDTRY